VLTFLAGAEIDSRSLKANPRASGLIGGLSFGVPLAVVWLFAQFVLLSELRFAVSVEGGERWKHRPEWRQEGHSLRRFRLYLSPYTANPWSPFDYRRLLPGDNPNMFRDGSARDRLIAELKRRISRINIRLDQQLLDLLDDREKEIIYDRMVNGKTLQQIGNKFGLTRERIRQIEANALQKMRRAVHRSVNT
jgi:hypothetical protein